MPAPAGGRGMQACAFVSQACHAQSFRAVALHLRLRPFVGDAHGGDQCALVALGFRGVDDVNRGLHNPRAAARPRLAFYPGAFPGGTRKHETTASDAGETHMKEKKKKRKKKPGEAHSSLRQPHRPNANSATKKRTFGSERPSGQSKAPLVPGMRTSSVGVDALSY